MFQDKEFTDKELLAILSLSKNATAIYSGEEIIIETVSDAMIAFWGKDRSVTGMSLEAAVPELRGQPFIDILKNVWHTGITYEAMSTPAELKVNDILQVFYFDFEYRAIKDAEGKMLCILHTATDVTDRVRSGQLRKQNEELKALNQELQLLREQELRTANEELKASNEELREAISNLALSQHETESERLKLLQLLQQAPMGVCIYSGADFKFEFVNDNLTNIIRKRDVLGKPLLEAFPEFRETVLREQLKKVYETGELFTQDEMLLSIGDESGNDLQNRYFTYRYVPRRNARGNVDGVYGFAFDVTDSMLVRTQLEDAYEESKLAREAARLGTFDFNLAKNVLILDERCRELFGITHSHAIDYEADFVQNIHPDDRSRVTMLINRLFADLSLGGVYDVDFRTLDGHLRWVRARGRVYFDADNKPDRFIGMVLDITEQKIDEQRKSDFIGMVSHEMKTPVTSLSAYLQMLQMRTNTEDEFAISMLERASKQVSRITTLINGFLNVSRLESGKIQIDKRRFDIAELVKEAEEETRSTINSHRVIFRPVKTTFIDADRDKISQVITNLISNAVKYSPANTEINVSCENVNGRATVCIKDQGIGIKDEDQPKLFERYYRVNENPGMASGFGIGLYLCAEIVQRHSGKIWVNSEVGKGSTFCFDLPVIA